MPWILILLAAALFAVPFLTTSVGLGTLCLLASLLLFVIGVMWLIASRVEGQERNTAQILSPQELHAMRMQADAQRAGVGATHSAAPPVAGVTDPRLVDNPIAAGSVMPAERPPGV
ncbi:MAG: hypothetical protein ABI748_13745 [Dokdonella sp.]